jgi:LmbE family N-acetylglucosaminyl deacetylase
MFGVYGRNLTDVLNDDDVERVLVVTAHPDDVDFGAAGTIATWTDRGIEVVYCIVTDGDAGGFDPATPRSDIAGIRQREQTAAAAAVGVSDLVFLGYPDGYLESSLPLRRDISRQIRRVRPQRVMCQSAVRNLDRIFASHPDHLAAGEAAICAVYPDARNEFWMPELLTEGYAPWSVPEVWIMAGSDANHAVDVTAQVDRKMRALRAHESQHQDPDGMEQRVRSWMQETAKSHNLAEGKSAEQFRVVVM